MQRFYTAKNTFLTVLLLSATAVLSSCGSNGGDGSNITRPVSPIGSTPSSGARYQASENIPGAQLQGKCMDAAHGDIDGDGDLDLVLAQEFTENIVLRNDGAGKFVVAFDAMNGGIGDNEDILLRDLDGDGDLDVISVHEDDRVHAFFVNDGEGQFVDMSSVIPVVGTANAVEALNINDDALLDILIGNDGANHALINNGDGTFVDETDLRFQTFGVTQDLLLVDTNGDGLMDVFVVNEGQNKLFLNSGNGRFNEAAAGSVPALVDESREADAADVDADGDLDLVVANVQFNLSAALQNRLWLNNSEGEFVDETETRLPVSENNTESFTIRFFDIDRDGDVDILSADNQLGAGGSIDIWLNDGEGKFSANTETLFSSPPQGSTFDIEIFDVNSDGLEDIYFCNRTGQDQLYLGIGSP